MGWPEVTVFDWAQLAGLFEGLQIGRAGDPSWQFRGQADTAWQLDPSLLRLLGRGGIPYKRAHGIEAGVFRHFVAQARIHFGEHLPAGKSGPSPAWWMLMQHHSCPTRLLDWSTSPYVAAYYAVEQMPERDGAVWVLPSSPLNTQVDRAFGDMHGALADGGFFSERPARAVYPLLGTEHNRRSLAQQGVYTVSTDILADHAPIIEDLLAQTSWAKHLVKVVVPARLKHDFLCRLRAMNITASSLFPGPDGVGRAASEYVRIRVWDSQEQPT